MSDSIITASLLPPVVGIWDDEIAAHFVEYRVGITFVDKVFGGVPQKPELIEGWLRTRIEGNDPEIKRMLRATLEELGYDLENLPADAKASDEAMLAAVKRLAAERNGNTFRRDALGIYLADYQVKAMLREAINILYAGENVTVTDPKTGEQKTKRVGWGPTSKGAKAYMEERVFVYPKAIRLTRGGDNLKMPDGVHLQIGQVSGPQGKRSTLTYYDYCEQVSCEIVLRQLVRAKELTPQRWKETLMLAQELGLGSIRSMQHGMFKITKFAQVGK